MRTTRSRAQEETYSSSSEEEEAAAAATASESGDSEPNDSTPASSTEKATLQVCGGHLVASCCCVGHCDMTYMYGVMMSWWVSNSKCAARCSSVHAEACPDSQDPILFRQGIACLRMVQQTLMDLWYLTLNLITAVLHSTSLPRGLGTGHHSQGTPPEIPL